MSHRPIEQKKRRRVMKAIKRKPLPARIDLVQWLVDRGHAPTRRAARELILAKRVKSESHVLGISKELVPAPTAKMDILLGREPRMREEEVVAPYVDASLRKTIMVI